MWLTLCAVNGFPGSDSILLHPFRTRVCAYAGAEASNTAIITTRARHLAGKLVVFDISLPPKTEHKSPDARSTNC
jgi:hypothetical protein